MTLKRRESRRTLLQRGALAATGLVGSALAVRLGAFSRAGSDAAGESVAKTPAPSQATAGPPLLGTLYLDQYTMHTAGRAAGAQRRKGDQTLVRGTLVDEQGAGAGEIFVSALTMPGPLEPGAPQTPRIEMQHLVLPDGTLIGTGTAFAQADRPNLYTIVGGSGRYTGARGSYQFDNDPSVARPEGRATITFDVTV